MARRLNEAEAIVSLAKKGEDISTSQRRHAVGYLMSTQPDLTNAQLAELFGVSDRSIREDKQWTRKQAAELVTQEDVSLIIADVRMKYEWFCQQLAASTKKATLGTANYANHLKLGMEMQLKVVDSLQSLGWLPKNLGELSRKSWNFTAIVTKDGTVDTRPVEMLDHIIVSPTSGSADELAARDAEFEEDSTLPQLTE